MNSKNLKLQIYIGEIIKVHRQNKNISLEKLGEKSNLDSTNIGRLERGEQLPSLITYFKLVSALKIDLSGDIVEIIKIINSNES